MTVLFVDSNVKGHHIPYLEAVSQECDDAFYILPEKVGMLRADKTHVFKEDLKTFSGYYKWLKLILKTAREKNVDIIQILYGDIIYRFFGIGLWVFHNYMTIVTFHHIRKGMLRDISLKRIFLQISMGIVHTDSLIKYVWDLGIENVKKIEYPVFEKVIRIPVKEARLKMSMDLELPTFLCFGGNRYDKGLDIFLNALRYIDMPIQIVIAGSADYFSEEFIRRQLTGFQGKVTLMLRFIEEDEIPFIFNSVDCVVLPYRKIFDGASGPLGIACLYGKTVIGPDNGSIGQIIKNYHLGSTFEAENPTSLARVMKTIAAENFVYDAVALSYQSCLDRKLFISEYSNIRQLLEVRRNADSKKGVDKAL